jgi:hypothetical protein
VGERRYFLYDITDPDVGGVFLPAGSGDRWLYGLLSAPGRLPLSVHGSNGSGRFAFAQVAARFRAGNAS